MKRKVIILLLALFAFTAAQAQQISVVSTSGSTHLYSTLQEAIEGASSGSVIYLPGGGFPVGDTVKITKKVTIIGIGHKSNNINVDGCTIIGGNLWFNQGSDGSAVMGCYISGNVNIGEDGEVDNILVKLCNINSMQVKNAECKGTIVNQNYVRGSSNYGNSTNITISNNVTSSFSNVNSGIIRNNDLCANSSCNNCNIIYNIIRKGYGISGSNNNSFKNFKVGETWGDYPITLEGVEENDVFVFLNSWTVNPLTDLHFNDTYKEYESQVGIYSGSGFSDSQLPPNPYIAAKRVPDMTDADGKLNIRVRVKDN